MNEQEFPTKTISTKGVSFSDKYFQETSHTGSNHTTVNGQHSNTIFVQKLCFYRQIDPLFSFSEIIDIIDHPDGWYTICVYDTWEKEIGTLLSNFAQYIQNIL